MFGRIDTAFDKADRGGEYIMALSDSNNDQLTKAFKLAIRSHKRKGS